MFLTADDLKALTGYVRASAQIRWLKNAGFRFAVNGLGDPVVAVAEINRKLVGGTARRMSEPNWAAMHEPQLRFDDVTVPGAEKELRKRQPTEKQDAIRRQPAKIKMLPIVGEPSSELNLRLLREALVERAAKSESSASAPPESGSHLTEPHRRLIKILARAALRETAVSKADRDRKK